MKKKIIFIMSLVTCGCTASYEKNRLAQQPIAKIAICNSGSKVENSNYNVFGIPIGARLALPACKTHGYFSETDKICFDRNESSSNAVCNETVMIKFPKSEAPSVAEWPVIYGLIVNGNLEGVEFFTDGYPVQEYVLLQLNQKYGEPKTLVPRKMQNAMGASYDAFIATWASNNLIVEYFSILNKIDSGKVRIYTNIGYEKDKQQTELRLKDPKPL